MKVDGTKTNSLELDKQNQASAFQVIVLGSGGGPLEDNVTGLLVRSTATNWAKGSVLAVDAGTHLAAVTRIIHDHIPDATSRTDSHPLNGSHTAPSVFSPPPPSLENQTPSRLESNGHSTPRNGVQSAHTKASQLVLSSGPFAGFELPHKTAKANAAYFVRNLITTYLITHPHLDHISGFVINTAGFQHTTRPKRLAGLPHTIDAFKGHIFNDTIWPNLSDEDGGVGLVSYMRLAEGGNVALGEGEGKGYIEVCDGIAVKGWGVSHGKCMHNHGKRSSGSGHTLEQFTDSSRRASASASTPNSLRGRDHIPIEPCVTDSSAFFLRDEHTSSEILIFGDVEPDSLSLSPRTHQVWADAAPKFASGHLKAILIECSYDESQSDETLFGHLAPRHVIAELQAFAEQVAASRNGGNRDSAPLKRKRVSNGFTAIEDISNSARKARPSQSQPKRKSRKSNPSPTSRRSESSGPEGLPPSRGEILPGLDVPTSIDEKPSLGHRGRPAGASGPLVGLQVIIIHVKDNLKDDPDAGETILKKLEELNAETTLGCTFEISKSGTSLWL